MAFHCSLRPRGHAFQSKFSDHKKGEITVEVKLSDIVVVINATVEGESMG